MNVIWLLSVIWILQVEAKGFLDSVSKDNCVCHDVNSIMRMALRIIKSQNEKQEVGRGLISVLDPPLNFRSMIF